MKGCGSVTQNPLMPTPHDRFVMTHVVAPAVVFLVAAAVLATTQLDIAIADRLFYDFDAARWIGKDTWWAKNLIHTGGRNLMRTLALLSLTLLIVASLRPSLARLRRPAGFMFACLALVPLIAGTLKQTTNVDCPWDYQRYGGTRPHVDLFEDRPDELPRAACFPGAHSSSGFALVSLYFLGLARSRKHALAGLGVGLLTGAVFAFGQEARGAHLLSHDLYSAFLAWFICVTLYAWPFRRSVMSGPDTRRVNRS